MLCAGFTLKHSAAVRFGDARLRSAQARRVAARLVSRSGAPAQVTVPFLRSEYGKEYDFDAPVKLLDAMMHAQADSRDQQARCPRAGQPEGL